MERRAAAILLMLSVVALLLVGATVAGNDGNMIRLPGGNAATEGTMPWECCDNPVCSNEWLCACKDVIKECACKSCKPVTGGFMCRDAAWTPVGGPLPCKKTGN